MKVNDILEVVEETEEGWWKGVLNGAVGMFPSNFVIELDNPEICNNKSNNNEITPTKSLSRIKNSDILETSLKKGIISKYLLNFLGISRNYKVLFAVFFSR